MIRSFTSAFTALLLVVPGLAQPQAGPGLARTIFADMVAEQLKPVRDHKLSPDRVRENKGTREERERAIRADPAAFVPLIREALTLPKPEALQVPTTPEGHVTDGSEQYQKQIASGRVAATALSLLPADVRDPILRESFDKTLALARPLIERGTVEVKDWVAAGRPETGLLAVKITGRRVSWFTGRCAELINSAAAAHSEVLVEPVFALFLNDHLVSGVNQQAVAYLEKFPPRYEEFIRRLNEILDSGRPIEFDRTYNIEQSIKRMQASRS